MNVLSLALKFKKPLLSLSSIEGSSGSEEGRGNQKMHAAKTIKPKGQLVNSFKKPYDTYFNI